MTRPRILAIDDNPANLATLARALSDEFTLQLATSGEEGLRLAAAERPDLVLLDVMMPVVDGFETCRRFKADPALADIPIVFVTAVVDVAAEIEGLRLGGADYLHKPINLGIARQRIRNLLERETLRGELDRHRGRLQILVDERARELIEARRLAEAASRAKSAFLAAMSQELRAPMHTIVGLAALGIGQSGLPSTAADALRRIHGSSRALLALIDDILEFSRMEARDIPLETHAFGIEDVLRKLTDVFAASARARGLELSVRLDPATPRRLVGDPLRLGQVLNNLVGNALKFTESGSVVVAVRPDGDSAAASDAGQTPRPGQPGALVRLRFAVSDTGAGMSREARERVWAAIAGATAGPAEGEPALHAGGNGLGLAISQRLIARMGGHLAFDSEPDKGSTFAFTISLPVAADEMQPPGRDAARVRGRRVLLVDPVESSRLALATMLAEGGTRVSATASGDEALALLAAAGTDPGNGFEAVLLDAVHDPWSERIALLRRMRALAGARIVAPTPRLLVATSPDGEADLRREAPDAPWDALLVAPITAERLLETLTAPVDPGLSAPASPVVDATATIVRDPAAARLDAAGEAPMPDPGFEGIEGIEAGDARQRLRGNGALFRYLLEQTGAQCGRALADARTALARGDRQTAAIHVHGLQGLLGDIGARDALALAVRAEHALRDPDDGDPGLRLDRLAAGTDALAAAIATHAAHREPAAAGPAVAIDDTALMALADLLEARDATALERHEALRPAIAHALGATFAQRLAAAIDGLQFADAAHLLRARVNPGGPDGRGASA